MKNKKIIIIIIIIIIILCITFLIYKNNKDKKLQENDPVTYWLNNLTLEEKISQMLVIYYYSDKVDENLLNLIKTNTYGGIIISKENITTYNKTKEFISTIQDNSRIPLIIGIDQEGGRIQNLKYLEDISPTNIPPMLKLGETNNPALAKRVGQVIAEELRTIGVNVTFAPSIDVYTNKENKVIGDRSFGTTPEIVSTMGLSLGEGLLENGVVPTYKHFPGHGDTKEDSHFKLPVVNKTKEELLEVELKPFINAIKKDSPLIMTSHIALPKITGNNEPATLSKSIITDLLKEELGYKGLVITDALNMRALTDNYTDEEIYTKAINAGCDLLLMPNGSTKAIEYIKKNIKEERIDESVRKILEFKLKYLKEYKPLPKEYLGNKSHLETIKEIENSSN